MRKTLAERFWEKVDKQSPTDCWNWLATKTGFGYGTIRVGSLTDGTRRKEMTHRLSYTMHTGLEIPKGKVVMHSCDNPSCVNPAHLSVGSYAENGKAAYDRKRRLPTSGKGEKSHRAILTKDDVSRIRAVGYTKSARELAEEFKVSKSTITAIRIGDNWKDD